MNESNGDQGVPPINETVEGRVPGLNNPDPVTTTPSEPVLGDQSWTGRPVAIGGNNPLRVNVVLAILAVIIGIMVIAAVI